MTQLARKIKIGIIQTAIDPAGAWNSSCQMIDATEELAIDQIKKGFASFKDGEKFPDIVLLPELSTPRGFKEELKTIAENNETIVIAGLDYKHGPGNVVTNEAFIAIPTTFGGEKRALTTTECIVRKTYPAPAEKTKIESLGYHFRGEDTVPIFDGGLLGKFAVAICYDLTDIERLSLYKRHIQTLLVIALNQDLTSFSHIAEAVMRMNFHHVVICNTGHFGGSLAVSPFYHPYERKVFCSEGPGLFQAQQFELELADIAKMQSLEVTERKWKELPPGYADPHSPEVVWESLFEQEG